MSEHVSSLRSRIAQLREAFIAQLPERLADARRRLAALQAEPGNHEAAVELHRVLHSIKGTGNSFGYRALAAAAGNGERVAARVMEAGSAVADMLAELEDCLAAMERETVVAPEAAAQPEIAPAFEMEQSAQDAVNDRLIYICDDDPLQAELLVDQLRCFGYQPEVFGNTDDLRRAIERQKPAAAIMDIMFPDDESAGTRVLTELRSQDTEVPAIFVSGRSDFDARLNAIRAGGVAYYAKPIKPMDLVVSLDMLTRKIEPEPFKVLVVDDEREIGEYHRLVLENAGMIVRLIVDPTEVIDMVGDFKPDLVLMDMYMPKCSGREVAKLIRQIPDFVSLPIIFLSSETDREKQFSAMSVGAEGFLTKPIRPEYLVASVALRAERMRTLRALMARDSLTGLFNHTTTTQLLESALTAAQRKQLPLSFAMLDLDRFKSINDTYGHPVGDQVLLAIARLLQQRLRASDLVGRYGGEEFAVILPDTGQDNARQIMDQLREDFGRILFHAGEVNFSATFSCGIAAYPAFGNVESLREAADKALYQAKREGRNRVQVYLG